MEVLYDANHDVKLIAERTRCKDICHRYNLLLPSQTDERIAIIRTLFGSTKQEFLI